MSHASLRSFMLALALGALGCSSASGVPGEPTTVPETVDTAQDPLRCGTTRCGTGQSCQEVSGEKRCVAADAGGNTPPGTPTSACAVTLCAAGTTCYETGPGKAECVPTPSCDGVSCAKGEHCELQEVQCVRAPCPPQPSCVADPAADPCAAVRCKAGTHCEAKEVQCIRAPCPPVAECVPDAKGVKCGESVCGDGQYCCNESCGICAPRGGACIQLFCEPKS
jgi:hypothetical protein